MYVPVAPLAALIAGILILAMPRLLNFIVALYLIAIGLLGLLARWVNSISIAKQENPYSSRENDQEVGDVNL
jgi:Protein of unknown function (DUF3096)